MMWFIACRRHIKYISRGESLCTPPPPFDSASNTIGNTRRDDFVTVRRQDQTRRLLVLPPVAEERIFGLPCPTNLTWAMANIYLFYLMSAGCE